MTENKPQTDKDNLAGTPSAGPVPAGKGGAPAKPAIVQTQAPGEVGGPKGLEPTRYGDWERNGIISDF